MATEIYESMVSFQLGRQYAAIVQHWKIVDPTLPNDFLVARDLVNAMFLEGAAPTRYITRLKNLLSEEVYISAIRARRIHPTGGNTFVRWFQSDAQVGARDGQPHTQQVAACIIWLSSADTNLTGRTFIPGISEDDLDGGRFTALYQVETNNFVERVKAGFAPSAGLFTPVIWRRGPKVGVQIDDGYVTPHVGTQRRREKPI